MSIRDLAIQVEKNIKNPIKNYSSKVRTESMRVILDKREALQLISPKQFKRGSMYRNNGKKVERISPAQSELLYKVAKYIIIKTIKSHEFKHDTLENLVKEAKKKLRNKEEGTYQIIQRPFKVHITKKNKRYTKIKATVTEIGYIYLTDGMLVLASTYGNIQSLVNANISTEIDKIFNVSNYMSGSGVTKEKFKKASTRSYHSVEDTYGRSSVEGKNRTHTSKTQVGHLDDTRLTENTATIQSESIVKSIAKHNKVTGLAKQVGLDDDDVRTMLVNLEKQMLNRFEAISVQYSALHRKQTSTILNSLNRLDVLLYVVQGEYLNETELKGLEMGAKKDLTKANSIENMFLETMADSLKNSTDIATLKGSPSWLTGILNTVEHKIVSSFKSFGSAFRVKKPKTSPGTNSNTRVKGKIKVKSRLKREIQITIDNATEGQEFYIDINIPDDFYEEKEDTCTITPQKLLAIQGRINYEIHDAIKANMKKPALVYRTGRFAKSVKVAGIKILPSCSLIAYYRYMVAPYAVFDPSISSYRGLSSPERNPQKIIGDSIRAIAQGIMRDRYTIHPQWI